MSVRRLSESIACTVIENRSVLQSLLKLTRGFFNNEKCYYPAHLYADPRYKSLTRTDTKGLTD